MRISLMSTSSGWLVANATMAGRGFAEAAARAGDDDDLSRDALCLAVHDDSISRESCG